MKQRLVVSNKHLYYVMNDNLRVYSRNVNLRFDATLGFHSLSKELYGIYYE